MRALEAGVTPYQIEMKNCWQKVEAARGRAVSLNIRQHYTEIRQALMSLLAFSKAL